MSNIFNPQTNKIYLDMDGVLADFDKFVLENLGRTFSFESTPEEETLMWTALFKIDRMYFQLEPTPYAFEIVEAAKAITPNVEILTAIPRKTTLPNAEQDKQDWIVKHFGPDLKVNFGPYSKNKWKHCKPGDVLVDDRPSNIEDWKTKAEGIAIFHEYKNHHLTLAALTKLKG